ncbi:MAG TPA: hypothetical protein DCM40_17555 [Maribacter sp.]|nr:hypothetical protein [Maribacter sp.]|tara:strand:+ start:1739 stop:1972 length:234 start_codon:yes stop_codon:yes gene_type:complete
MRKILAVIAILFISTPVFAKSKARFYDFSDQLIDGSIKKPSTIYMEARTRAKFAKLLTLKKSFIPRLLMTGKESLLK